MVVGLGCYCLILKEQKQEIEKNLLLNQEKNILIKLEKFDEITLENNKKILEKEFSRKKLVEYWTKILED